MVASGFKCRMELNHSVTIGIIGCQIGASTEPSRATLLQEKKIHVNSRDVRFVRVKNEQNAGAEELASLGWINLGRQGWEQFTVHGREVDTYLLKQGTALNHAGLATPGALALPQAFVEVSSAVRPYERPTNLVLG